MFYLKDMIVGIRHCFSIIAKHSLNACLLYYDWNRSFQTWLEVYANTYAVYSRNDDFFRLLI
jgi:hypothetical protein